MSESYAAFHRRSIEHAEAFWLEQAELIHWRTPPVEACDYSNPPFAQWFRGGTTNLCYNAVDRHLTTRPDQNALIFVSSETGQEECYTFSQLHLEVQAMAVTLQGLGVRKGDLVLVYMPMIPQAAFVMLACVRIGAIHSVVFGGFASASLASRIDDARPTVIVSADAGMRAGKILPYKPLLDAAIGMARHEPRHVLMVDRKLAPLELQEGRDVEYGALRTANWGNPVPCEWVDATHTSYTLYTSGTTGRPKGVQRDTGGYAVALAASMKHIFCGREGETFFSTSDIGWVVGHSYIIYGPLLAGMATIMYEGLPTQPDAGVWWQLVAKYKVTVMFSAPTAIRVLKKQDASYLRKHDVSSLRHLFLAGEPLDESTAAWITDALGKPVIDNYWQTETGWPILTLANGVESGMARLGSPGVPMYGYHVKLLDETTGEELVEAGKKGVMVIDGPLPPGCLQTIWGDDARYVQTYWRSIPGQLVYNTFDWGIRDADGYYFILGRTDDVINVAGHRLGTREIEEIISSDAQVAEVAVVGVADELKGQVAVAFVVCRQEPPAIGFRFALERHLMELVGKQLGAVARPSRIHFVEALPKTRSGKVLRRVIQAICEHRDLGDLTAIEDPAPLAQINEVVRTIGPGSAKENTNFRRLTS